MAEAAVEVTKQFQDSLVDELKSHWKEQKEKIAAQKAKDQMKALEEKNHTKRASISETLSKHSGKAQEIIKSLNEAGN